MWECEVCSTTGITNQYFCPSCFTPRPGKEAGEMAESDGEAPGDVPAADAIPDAEPAVSGDPSPPESADSPASGYSEAEPSAGGFLTDWGKR
jgi:hypothetical protein